MAAQRFVSVAIGTYLAGLSGLIAFSVWVNSSGRFGPTGYLDIAQYNDRLVKASYMDNLPPAERPTTLVLGSSNLMTIRARDIEALTGRRAFNCYVTGAQAEDHLCLVRHFVFDLDYRPELLIVGLETWTFQPPDDNAMFAGVPSRLVGVPQMIRHHPDAGRIRRLWANAVDSVSREQLTRSWGLLMDDRVRRKAWGPLADSPIIELDGSFHYAPGRSHRFGGRLFQLDDDGEFGITREIQRLLDLGEVARLKHFSFFDWRGLWPRRVEYFEQFLDLCQREGIGVVLVANPVHPLMWDVLTGNTPHRENHTALLRKIAEWSKRYTVVRATFDATDIASFGGEPDNFYDGTHCAPKNARRLVERIVKAMTER